MIFILRSKTVLRFISSKASDGNMLSLENRKRFFEKIGVNPKKVAEVKQVHSNNVLVIDEIIDSQTEADGLTTNNPQIYLTMKVADCMAIGFYDSRHNAVGLVHTGYRGLEKGIIKNVVEKMIKNFKTSSKDLIVIVSPSIGPCHYRMDIWKEAENQLIKLGILGKNIDNPKICTYESFDYFSHRRSEDTNTVEGRFVTILGIK